MNIIHSFIEQAFKYQYVQNTVAGDRTVNQMLPFPQVAYGLVEYESHVKNEIDCHG